MILQLIRVTAQLSNSQMIFLDKKIYVSVTEQFWESTLTKTKHPVYHFTRDHFFISGLSSEIHKLI